MAAKDLKLYNDENKALLGTPRRSSLKFQDLKFRKGMEEIESNPKIFVLLLSENELKNDLIENFRQKLTLQKEMKLRLQKQNVSQKNLKIQRQKLLNFHQILHKVFRLLQNLAAPTAAAPAPIE